MRLTVFFLSLLSVATTEPLQAVLSSPPTISSVTLVDKLSNDSDYTSLIRLLQHAKLIPTLNRLNGSTFFAPTNDAIRKHATSNALWKAALAPGADVLDNINEQLRDQLLYHLLNYTLSVPNDTAVVVTHTLHFPHEATEPPTDEPPPLPPWLPVPGGSLGGEAQRLRLASRSDKLHVGVNAFGDGGAKVVKDVVDAGNGVLLGIDRILQPPSHLADVIGNHSSLSYFSRILTPSVKELIANTSALTLFVPVDSAFDALPQYERLYLESEFATDDLLRIYEMHAVVQQSVAYSDVFEPAINLTTLHGQTLEIVGAMDKIYVADSEVVEPDIYASNGVLHTLSSLLIPPDALQITPEKLLLTYNCSTFISLLHSVNLTHLVNNTETAYTILAPQDDVITIFGSNDLPEKGSPELQKLLRYHFLPGKWTPKKLKSASLVETELVEEGLDNGRQVLQVEVTGKDKADTDSSPSIRFGGASVVGDPLVINNSTVIYFISRPIFPPADSMQVALPSLDLSNFLAAVFSADLAETVKTAHRTTVLIPRNTAFKRLGTLVSAHLLSASAKTDLRHTILHHVLSDVLYADDLRNGSARTFSTREGSDVHMDRGKNGSLILTASGGWPGLSSTLQPRNVLSSTGVVHELSDVLLPRSVDLSLGKLVKAATGTTMATIITRAGMDWILNGTAPPPDSRWEREGVKGTGWTLLCPSDDAFKNINLTTLYSNANFLQEIVAQHLVQTPRPETAPIHTEPNANHPLALGDKAAYSTLLSLHSDYGDVVFRLDGESFLVGIKDARGTNAKADWAHIEAWGRATTGGGAGGVLQIDRLLMPYRPPWWIAYGVPIAVGVLGVAVILGFFALVRVIWRRDVTEATYEPIGGFVNDDEEEP